MAEPDPRMDFSKPSPLRLVGFLLVAVGGLIAGVGAMLTWFTVGLSDDKQNVLTQRYLGVDLLEGKIVLAAGVILLGGILAVRRVRGALARRAVAGVLIVASLLIAGIAVAAATGTHRLGDRALQDMAKTAAAALKIPLDLARQRVDRIASLGIIVTRGIGIWLALLGGLLGLAGAVLSLTWVLRREDAEEVGDPTVAKPRADTGSD
jgi:cytochrome bd-type quinol oxidase subunit 2